MQVYYTRFFFIKIEVFIMDKKEKNKKKELETAPFPVIPVGRGFPSSTLIGKGGIVRVSPESRSEAGILTRCMTCNHKAPQQEFLSENKIIFKGCPNCGEIDRSKMVYISEDGIIPNEANGHPKDFSEYVGKEKQYDKMKPIEHQLRQNFI